MPDTKKTFVKVSKALPEPLVEEINEVSYINKKRKDVEVVAKNDSIASANNAKLKGSTVYMQKKHGNDAANKVRKEGGVGNPQVQRFTNPHQYSSYEPHTGEKDAYIRDGKLEKEMPSVKKTYVKIASK